MSGIIQKISEKFRRFQNVKAVITNGRGKRERERLPPSGPMRELRKRVNPEESAQVLQQRRHARPERLLSGRQIGSVEHHSKQIDAEEADSPQTDDPGEGEERPDDRVLPPTRIGEELGE